MASPYIVLVLDGELTTHRVRRLPDKRKRKTLINWKASCASLAIDKRCRRYAARFKDQWHVMGVDHPEPIRSFATEAQASMWLLHRGGK